MIRRWQHPASYAVVATAGRSGTMGVTQMRALSQHFIQGFTQRFVRSTALLILLPLSACQWHPTAATSAQTASTSAEAPAAKSSAQTMPETALSPQTTQLHGIQMAAPFPTALISSEIWLPAGTFHAHIEGPTMDAAGNFYAVNVAPSAAEVARHAATINTSNIKNTAVTSAGSAPTALGRIGKVTPAGEVSTLLQLPAGSIGNGLQFDQQGALWIADYKAHKIWRWHHQQLTAVWTIPAMYQPNDLVVTKQGVIFATDPSWAKGIGQLWRLQPSAAPHMDNTVENVAGEATPATRDLSDADLPDGVTLLQAMGTSNGIALSPDERWLYVNESKQRRVWRFALMPDATLGPAQLIFEFADHGLDGMDTSSDGDLWISRHGKGTVVRLSADGQWRAEYCLHGQFPSNLVFSSDGAWLYVTMQRSGSVERLAVKHAQPCG